MTTVVISQPMFLPWLGMFEQARLADIFVHYNDVQFSKGSLINRVQVKTPQGPAWLTAPLDHRRSGRLINQCFYRDRSAWLEQHQGLLRQSYKGAPLFEMMRKVYGDAISGEDVNVASLNSKGFETICRHLKIATRFANADGIAVELKSSERVLSICKHFGADRYVTGLGGLRYLDHELFERNAVRVEYMNYRRAPYPQLHGPFDPHVSILDTIANCGQEARDLLTSRTVYWRELIDGPR